VQQILTDTAASAVLQLQYGTRSCVGQYLLHTGRALSSKPACSCSTALAAVSVNICCTQDGRSAAKILHTQDDICCKHYYIVSYKSALTLLKYEFLNSITTAGFALCRPGRINLL